MKWIEIVQVRTGIEDGGPGLQVLRRHAQGLRGAVGLLLITVVKHTLYQGDIAAVLVWENERAADKTREGYALVDAMAHYGLTEHAVWKVVAESGSIQTHSAAGEPRPPVTTGE